MFVLQDFPLARRIDFMGRYNISAPDPCMDAILMDELSSDGTVVM
jgi:hypothetical protein